MIARQIDRPMPHSVGLRREQRVEHPIDVLRADSYHAIRNRYHDAVAFVWLRFDAEHPWIFLGGHRVNGIGDHREDHRGQVMRKMKAGSLPALVTMASKLAARTAPTV
jgi:hypothetical protein